jgi:hypothetical protein
MFRNTDKQARAEAMLGEIAELGLVVARELATRLRETEDADEAVALADAFHKATRVVRLTLALDAKLERDAARDAAAEARQAQADADAQAARDAAQQRADAWTPKTPEATDPLETRKARVRGLVNRLLWNESESDEEEYEVLVEDLNARLDEAALSPDFAALPIETLTRRVIADMGLSGRFALSLGEPPGAQVRAAPRSPALADTG